MLWKKIKHSMGIGSGWAWAVCNLNGVVKIGLMKCLTFKKRLARGEGEFQEDSYGRVS